MNVVSFGLATFVFADPHVVTIPDESEIERRCLSIEGVKGGVILARHIHRRSKNFRSHQDHRNADGRAQRDSGRSGDSSKTVIRKFYRRERNRRHGLGCERRCLAKSQGLRKPGAHNALFAECDGTGNDTSFLSAAFPASFHRFPSCAALLPPLPVGRSAEMRNHRRCQRRTFCVARESKSAPAVPCVEATSIFFVIRRKKQVRRDVPKMSW